MRLRSLLVVALLLGLWASSGLALGTGGSSTSPTWPVNSLVDRDGDGLPDYARVGDYDHDGVLEIDDLQDVVNGLTDPGPKLILVTPGVYLPPAAGARRAGRSHALLELGSFTTLECSGVGKTILRGGPVTVGWNLAVVSNHDHSPGNDEVWIKSCEVDGGAPPTYASDAFPLSQRMGVLFWRTRHSGVSDSYVHDTVHAGLYTANSTGDRFLRNRVEDAGGYGDTTRLWRQPCIYLFAVGGGAVLSDFQAIGNTLSRCGHSGLNTRPRPATHRATWSGTCSGSTTPWITRSRPASACGARKARRCGISGVARPVRSTPSAATAAATASRATTTQTRTC